jgi:hypothetical protein
MQNEKGPGFSGASLKRTGYWVAPLGCAPPAEPPPVLPSPAPLCEPPVREVEPVASGPVFDEALASEDPLASVELLAVVDCSLRERVETLFSVRVVDRSLTETPVRLSTLRPARIETLGPSS